MHLDLDLVCYNLPEIRVHLPWPFGYAELDIWELKSNNIYFGLIIAAFITHYLGLFRYSNFTVLDAKFTNCTAIIGTLAKERGSWIFILCTLSSSKIPIHHNNYACYKIKMGMFPAIAALSLVIELSCAKAQGQNLKIYFTGNKKNLIIGALNMWFRILILNV